MVENDDLRELVIFNKYKTEKKIGAGSFGVVYSGRNIRTKQKVAIKLENLDDEINMLETEAYTMAYLKGDGIPEMYCYGYNSKYHIMVMEILGDNLEKLFNDCKNKFSLKTVLYLAVQMLERLKFVHEKSILHRDLKPENFLIGLDETEKQKKIYLIDYGLSSKYRSHTTKEHIEMRTDRSMTGTARYASLNAHLGYEQSRRDDLESLGYILIYFLKSCLPWQGIQVKTIDEKLQKIKEMKSTMRWNDLCCEIPNEFSTYMQYCRSLAFKDDPNYDFLISLFHNLMDRENFNHYLIQYDWNKDESISFVLPSSPSRNLSDNLSQNLNKSNNTNNKSAVVMIEPSVNSVNISQLQHKITSKTTNMSSILKKKTTANSIKRVSFKNVEIVSVCPDGNIEKEIIELPQLKVEVDNSKKKLFHCKCLVF